MKIWPASLPQYVGRQQFQLEAFRPKIAFEPDEGLPIERRNGSVDIDDMTWSFYLRTLPIDLVAVFRTFVDEDLEGGALEFEFPRHPITGAVCIVKITGDRPYVLQPISGVEYLATMQVRVSNL